MLTPQDIQEKEFSKAVFGGYDMGAVDDFLEEVTESYTELYNESGSLHRDIATLQKDNATLKAKLKVLVEKVEEYRSTEDAMRMALLTAQKMSDDMTAEARKKSDEMMAEAQNMIAQSRAGVEKELGEEQAKLEAAKARTVSFVQASRVIIEQYNEFLEKLGEVTKSYGGAPVEAPAAGGDIVRSPEPEPAPTPTPAPAPAREPVAAPVREPSPAPIKTEVVMNRLAPRPVPPARRPEEEDDAVGEIGDVVNDVMAEQDASAHTRRFDVDAVRRAHEEIARSAGWDEEDEKTTPRPKYDFSDLDYVPNRAEETKKKKK